MLDIRLLGTPRVFLRGEGISIPRKTTRSLLFYLAMHPKGVRRDELVELFFGHQDGDEVQRKSLRRYLNFVRNIAKGDEFVENYHDTIRLKASFVKVDALVLFATVEKIKRSNGSFRDNGRTIPLGIYQEALDAVSLLEGDTFIDSTDMDKFAALSLWKEAENSRLRNARNSLFMFLAEMDSRQGNPEKASLWAERALELDASEDAHYLLLKSLREMGQLDKARKHYLDIQEDFGAGISEKLRSLGEEILNMPETSVLYVRPDWAIRPSVPVPFVGQSAILERLQINRQRGVGTLITGEAGSGKTRLVKAFFEELPRTSNLLLVPCYRDSERLSYQPWTDMLRHSFHEEFWQSTPAWWTKPLTMLLPELLVYRDDLDVKPDEVFSNELVFEAVKNLLIFANQKGAALLFVEDAHWMNPISFALLKYLILQSTFKQWNIDLVVTSRLGIHSGVDRFEFDAMMGKMEEIEISRLGDEEIKYLAFYLLNDELPAEKIAALKKMTGGNPFFLLEFLSFHKLNDVDIFKDSVSSPPSVQQLIEARLNTLTSQARKLLNYAAVQGYHFDLAILEEVLMLPMEEMTALIAELEEARLVHFLSKDDGLHYAFFHENLRSDIVNLLSPAKQRVLHAKFAAVLAKKSIYQNEWAAVLAEHYEQAGAFSDAFSAWFTAAKHAYRIFSSKDAHIAYQHAEALLPHLSFSEDELYEFYTNWGSMLFNSDDPDALEVVMQSMLAHGERLGSGLLLGAALDGLSDVHMARNEFKKGLERVEDALAYLIMDGHIPAQMNAFIHQGVFLYMLNNFPAALESFNTVLSLGAGRTDDPQTTFAIGHANYQIAASLTGMGYPQKAIRYAKESIRVMRLSNVPHTSILAHSIMGLANYYLGHYDEGKQNALISLELAQKSKSWRMAGYAVAYTGLNETELSELGLAWEHAKQAVRYGEQYGHTEIVSMGYKVFGDIYTRLGALVQAAKFYQRGVDADNASFAKFENAARLGVTLGLLGDPRADAVLEEALSHAKAAGLETIEINAKALQLRLFITRKEYAAFDANLGNIRTALAERSDPKSVVWTDYLQAVRLFQEEQYEEALALLEKTLAILEETRFFWIRLSAYKLYLELLKALERNLAPTRTKLAEMLNQIEANLGDAPLQEEWQIFSERIKEM